MHRIQSLFTKILILTALLLLSSAACEKNDSNSMDASAGDSDSVDTNTEVEWLNDDQPFEGYTLFQPQSGSRNTYLVDMNGTIVHTWSSSYQNSYTAYLLENGNILRSSVIPNEFGRGPASGLIEEISWESEVIWSFEYHSPTHLSHHDIEPLPNGNILLIAWEKKTAAQAYAAGRTEAEEMWPFHIIEVDRMTSEIVWRWHVWDHLIQDIDPKRANYGIVSEHPELININVGSVGSGPGGGGDWLHVNAISYNPVNDQIVFSSHYFNELYIIDHSTADYTNPQAGIAAAAGHTGGNAGKGGDILYRWGNPAQYDAPGEQYFHVVHCATWIPTGLPGAGNILAFNNGENNRVSEVIQIVPPVDKSGHYILEPGQAFGPQGPVWRYTATDFFSAHLGGNQRLPNGNTLIAESTDNTLIEINKNRKVLWTYHTENGVTPRALRYAKDYPGLSRLNINKHKRR